MLTQLLLEVLIIASLIRSIAASPGAVLIETTGDRSTTHPHLPQVYDFRQGKMWPNERPGLGVTFDASEAEQVLEVIEQSPPIPLYSRPDGSVTNW